MRDARAVPAVISLLAALAVCPGPAWSADIHVSTDGKPGAAGTPADPHANIGAAAAAAGPGDTVIVHGGTYREWVTPPRGGTGEEARITYRAAAGEQVVIAGSERIRSWRHDGGGVWTVRLPASFFGDYNPYALTVSGGWLNYGKWHHRGDVYLDGAALRERQTPAEVRNTPETWCCRADGKTTTITANFAAADPNEATAEINVRECLFMPVVTGLKYITIDGFHFRHAASNWAPPVMELQTGAVGTRMGKRWIIENCTITDCRCVGIIIGHAPGVDYTDIDAFGDHVVRNNVIRRCGQAGIAGQKGATRSVIAGNLIEDTNYRKEFGGWETAAIKFHNSVDTVIRGNLIRGVYHQKQGAFGIWIDYANQSIRITGNIIYDTRAATIFLEMNHGPILVDNNVLVGQSVRSNSEATVFAHNLFVDCGYVYRPDTRRRSAWYAPHTTKPVGRKPGTARDDRWYNNIFVRKGLDDVKKAPGYRSDWNLFLEGAKKSSFGDEHSIADSRAAGFDIAARPAGATMTFSPGPAAAKMKGPRVDAELVGVFSTVKQTIEDRRGDPIGVDRDINGNPFGRPVPGPLADLRPGQNTIAWSMGRP